MGKITAADRRAARAIEYDITDRGGLRQAWDRMHEETQREIRDVWRELVAHDMQPERDRAAAVIKATHRLIGLIQRRNAGSLLSMVEAEIELQKALAAYEKGASA